MTISEILLPEFLLEMSHTTKLIRVVPIKHSDWTPHPKSRSLSELTKHIVKIPSLFIIPLGFGNEFDYNSLDHSDFEDVNQLVERFELSVLKAKKILENLSDELMLEDWSYKYGKNIIYKMPRVAVIRAMGLNHIIHHRAQLSVYLRMLNIALPPIYGPTADEK